jgi:hypothetical protein
MVMALPVSAQTPARPNTSPATTQPLWSIDGLVQLGKRAGPLPVRDQWVVVHRIASDSLGNVSGGPLDSARTDTRGRYRIKYPRSAGPATYIAITTYQGVSYISAPLMKPVVTGDDAAIMVFDTISPPYPIKVAGRHLVVGAPGTDDRRRVVEMFELLNDSTHTVMGSESNPVWRAAIPAGARDLEINPEGDISPAMTKIDGQWLEVFSPISPGLRQISFSYTLGPEQFPLVMPLVDSVTVFELLVQEPEAVIEGGGFTEVAATIQDGIPFRRLLARDVPHDAEFRLTVPASVGRGQSRLIGAIAAIVGTVMVTALGVVFWKRRRPVRASRQSAPSATSTDALIRALASLDAEFERRQNPTEAERTEFNTRRAALKAELNAVLAAQKAST